MQDKETILQLKAELAAENQELTTIIENQEYFYTYLKELRLKNPKSENLINEIIDKFKTIMI